jgi:hypothetical protein
MRSAPVRSGSECLAGIPLRRKLGKREQRSSVRLYKSWDEARGWDRLPRLQDFDLGTLEELGGSCFLLVEGEEGAASRFRYFGRELAKEIGRDLAAAETGRGQRPVPSPSGGSALSRNPAALFVRLQRG